VALEAGWIERVLGEPCVLKVGRTWLQDRNPEVSLTRNQRLGATQPPNLLQTHKGNPLTPLLFTADFSSSIIVMRRISEDTRNSILALLDSGLSSREVGARLGVSHMTVSRVRAEARPDAPKSRGGQPAKLTAVDKRRLVRMVTSAKADNAVQATRQLRDITNVDCSVYTVRRALKEAGLKAASKSRGFRRSISSNAAPSP
jgi:transposase